MKIRNKATPSPYMDNKARERYNQFNKRNINNTILNLEQYARGINIPLINPSN